MNISKQFNIIFGAFLILASLWITTYIIEIYTSKHWTAFPTVMTGCFGFIVGVVFLANGMSRKT